MRVAMAWGRQHLELDVAAENVVAARRAQPSPALADPAAALRQALDEPFDFPALRRALTPDDHVVVFVDERVPQLVSLLVPILEHIRSAGVAAEAITLLCLPPSRQRWRIRPVTRSARPIGASPCRTPWRALSAAARY